MWGSAQIGGLWSPIYEHSLLSQDFGILIVSCWFLHSLWSLINFDYVRFMCSSKLHNIIEMLSCWQLLSQVKVLKVFSALHNDQAVWLITFLFQLMCWICYREISYQLGHPQDTRGKKSHPAILENIPMISHIPQGLCQYKKNTFYQISVLYKRKFSWLQIQRSP